MLFYSTEHISIIAADKFLKAENKLWSVLGMIKDEIKIKSEQPL
ncbi:hypothetical protein [Clostridium saccharobutylicum]